MEKNNQNNPLGYSSPLVDSGELLMHLFRTNLQSGNALPAMQPEYQSSMRMMPLGSFQPCDISAGMSAPRVPAPSAPAHPVKTSEKPVRVQVDHSYTDYSLVADDDLEMLERTRLLPETGNKQENLARQKIKDMASRFGPTKSIKIEGVRIPFTVKLMQVLNRRDMEGVIRWMPHGRAFKVIDHKACVNDVLPRFFKQSKWTSFVRQLNLWGFKRLTHGEDIGAYYHECFLRGRPNLCMRIRRQKNKGVGIKPWPNPLSEPSLYKFPHLPELDPDRPMSPLPPLSTDVPNKPPATKASAARATLASETDNSSQLNAVEVSLPSIESNCEVARTTGNHEGLLSVPEPMTKTGFADVTSMPFDKDHMKKITAFGGAFSQSAKGEDLIDLEGVNLSSFLGFQPGELSDASVANLSIDGESLSKLKGFDESSLSGANLEDPSPTNLRGTNHSIDWKAVAMLFSHSDSNSGQKYDWSTPSPIPDDDLFANGSFDWGVPGTPKEVKAVDSVNSDLPRPHAFDFQIQTNREHEPSVQMPMNSYITLCNGAFGQPFVGLDPSRNGSIMHQPPRISFATNQAQSNPEPHVGYVQMSEDLNSKNYDSTVSFGSQFYGFIP